MLGRVLLDSISIKKIYTRTFALLYTPDKPYVRVMSPYTGNAYKSIFYKERTRTFLNVLAMSARTGQDKTL